MGWAVRTMDVMVVDEDPLWRTSVAMLLRGLGVGRVTCGLASCAEAIRWLDDPDRPSDPHVLILHSEPVLATHQGIAEAQELHTALSGRALILLLADRARSDRARRLVATEAHGDTLRTVDPSELVDTIQRVAEAAEDLAGAGARGAAVLPQATDPAEDAPGLAVRDAEATGHLRREPPRWTVRFGGRSVTVPDLRGIGYLALLLSAPNVEVHALDLSRRARGGTDQDLVSLAPRGLAGLDDLRPVDDGGVGPRLDQQAKRSLRARAEVLRQELGEALAMQDATAQARIRLELEAIADTFTRAVGLGDRDRPVRSDAERARVAVTRSLRRAVDRMAEVHPELGDHLRPSVRTGTYCSYRPAEPVTWRVG